MHALNDMSRIVAHPFHHIQLIRGIAAIVAEEPDCGPKALACCRKLGVHFHEPILELVEPVCAEDSPGPGPTGAASRVPGRDRGQAVGFRNIRREIAQIGPFRGNRELPRANLIPLAGVDRRPIELVTPNQLIICPGNGRGQSQSRNWSREEPGTAQSVWSYQLLLPVRITLSARRETISRALPPGGQWTSPAAPSWRWRWAGLGRDVEGDITTISSGNSWDVP